MCNSGYFKDWIIVNSSVKWKEFYFIDINVISYRYVLEFCYSWNEIRRRKKERKKIGKSFKIWGNNKLIINW